MRRTSGQTKGISTFTSSVAAAGSALGGLVPFLLGRAGGELFLMKRINRARYEQLRDRFEKQEFLALMIPSILPPPTPWKLFVFAAGVFEMKISTFLLSVFVGRVMRNMITAILTIEYGPQIVSIAGRLASQHRVALIAGLAVLLAVLVYWIWRSDRQKRRTRSLPGWRSRVPCFQAAVHHHGGDAPIGGDVDPGDERRAGPRPAAKEHRIGKSKVSELNSCIQGLRCEFVGSDQVRAVPWSVTTGNRAQSRYTRPNQERLAAAVAGVVGGLKMTSS